MATARQSCTTVKMPCIRCVGALVSSACRNSGEQKIEREAGDRSARDEEWACQLEGSNTFEGAGVGYPEPAERAGNDQQARLPLVGARGMERGTHVSNLVGSQHRRGTSVSRELHKKKVSNSVMAKRRPSENNLCENGTVIAKSVIPRKGPTCEDSDSA